MLGLLQWGRDREVADSRSQPVWAGPSGSSFNGAATVRSRIESYWW